MYDFTTGDKIEATPPNEFENRPPFDIISFVKRWPGSGFEISGPNSYIILTVNNYKGGYL
jgi:hypothetical protein